MNRRWMFVVVLLLMLPARAWAADKVETIDDFLANPVRLRDVKAFCMIIASQADPAMAAHNAEQFKQNYWAALPEAQLTPQEREIELGRFDVDWKRVADVVKERNIKTIYFTGVDNILPVKKAQYWYFSAFTPRGPVLFRIQTQYNEGSPSVHGIKVWTDWDEMKAIGKSIEIRPSDKVWSVTYDKEKKQPTTAPSSASL